MFNGVGLIALAFLFVTLVIALYSLLNNGLGPIAEGVRKGTLVTGLYLFAVHYFFVSGIIWLGVASVIVATLLIIKNIL